MWKSIGLCKNYATHGPCHQCIHMRSVRLETRAKQIFIWFESNPRISTNFRSSKVIYVSEEQEGHPSNFRGNENCAVFVTIYMTTWNKKKETNIFLSKTTPFFNKLASYVAPRPKIQKHTHLYHDLLF